MYVSDGDWYCSPDCQSKSRNGQRDKRDSKNAYVRALTFMGLMDLVRLDAVRENDGLAMMSHWRMDMLQFHNRHHPKYVLLAHRLLAGNNLIFKIIYYVYLS